MNWLRLFLNSSPSLAEALNAAQKETGDRVVGDVGRELHGRTAQELIVQVHPADFGVRPERNAVSSFDPPRIVGQGVIGTREASRRVVAETEDVRFLHQCILRQDAGSVAVGQGVTFPPAFPESIPSGAALSPYGTGRPPQAHPYDSLPVG